MNGKLGLAAIAVCLLFVASHAAQQAPHLRQANGPSPDVVQLNDNNWRDTLKNEWVVEFHAPWCPACRSLAPAWNEFARASKQLGISVAQVDVTTSPALSGRFFVTALPTIFHVKDGVYRQYRGPRDESSLRTMIQERKWDTLEPISTWKYPDSFLMTVVANFFSLSHYLKELNDHLQEAYHFPIWMAYALFAIVTIFLGAFIGLVFVCIVDVLIPPRRISRRKLFSEIQTDPLFEDYPNEDFEIEEPSSDSTSDDEKYSGTDSDAEADKKKSDTEAKTSDQEKEKDQKKDEKSPKASPEVRKRNKTRKD